MKRVLTFVLIFSMMLGLMACGGKEPATKPYTTIPAPKNSSAAAETKTGEETTASEPSPTEDPDNTGKYKNYDLTGIHFLEKGFTDKKITDEATAAAAASACNEAIGCRNALNELRPFISTAMDGQNYYRLQQYYHGIPVYGRYVNVTASSDGEALELSTDAKDIPDDIDLLPTAEEGDILNRIKEYASQTFGVSSDTLSAEPVSSEKLTIYDMDDAEPSRLAYNLKVQMEGPYQVIVDAKTAEVLEMISLEDAATGRLVDGTPGPIEKLDDEHKIKYGYSTEDTVYHVKDKERNFTIVNYYKKDSHSEDGASNAKFVTSTDEVFGSTDAEKNQDPEKAFHMINNIAKIQDWYIARFSFPAPQDGIQLGFNDSWDSGTNAYYAPLDGDKGMISIEYGLTGKEQGVLAHEYTHLVQHRFNAAYSNLIDSKTLREGLSDVFACFYTGDWSVKVSGRNAADPGSGGNPSNLNDRMIDAEFFLIDIPGEIARNITNLYSSDYLDWYSHKYATVISHAAYLMSQSGAFDTDQLARLWYTTMIWLPYNCSFINLRSCMEHRAVNLNCTKEQKDAIAEAFDAVGITYDSEWNYTNDIFVKVSDQEGLSYDDYIVEVINRGRGSSGKWNSSLVSRTVVDNSDPLRLHLEDGKYKIRITDRANSDRSVQYLITVNSANEPDTLEATGFGAAYTCAPGARMTVLDKNGNVLTDYKASTVGETPYTEIRNGTIPLQEKNYYNMVLTHREGDVMRMLPFTLRVKKGAVDNLTIQTQFTQNEKNSEKETSSSESTTAEADPYADVKERLQGPWQTSNRLYLFCFKGDRVERYHKATPGEPDLRYVQDTSTGYRIEPMDDGKGVKVILDDAQNGTEYWYFDETPNGLDCFWYSNGEKHYSGSSSLDRVTKFTMDDIEVVPDPEKETAEGSEAKQSTEAESASHDQESPYAEIVRQYESKYGALNIKTAGSGRAAYKYYTGVFLVKLIDFDVDGTEELLIGYASEIPQAHIASPKMDVWGMQSETPVRLHEGACIHHGDIGSRCEYLVLNGSTVLVTGFDASDIKLSFLKLEQGRFKSVKMLEYTYTGKDYQWSVDGEKVSETDGMKLYNIVRNNMGKYNGSLTSSAKQTEESLIMDLEAGYASLGMQR